MPSLGRWTDWKLGRSSALEFAALFLLGLFMAFLGPFRTAEAGLGMRLAFWLACMMGGGVIGAVIEPALLRLGVLRARPRVFAAAQALAMTPPVTLLVALLNSAMFSGSPSLVHYGEIFPQVLVVDVGVVLLAWMIRRLLRQTIKATAKPTVNPLADRLPPALARARLVAVEAEDHYLRIHTEAGDALIYMRFTDALAAAASGDGLQVHRSWWVARRAVQAAAWREGRGELTLTNGLAVPVSRSFAKTVKATNWAEAADA